MHWEIYYMYIHPQSGRTLGYARRQRVGLPLQPFEAANICGQTEIDRQTAVKNVA